MKTVSFRRGSSPGIFAAIVSFVIAFAGSTHADQVDMQNGDRYSGKILALESNSVLLKSDVLGTLRIRRDKIASVSFGATATTPSAAAVQGTTAPGAVPKAPPVPVVSAGTAQGNPQIDLNSSISHLIASNPELVSEIQSQVLAGAGPKALKKYDSLVGGLSSGELNIADLRKEAASVASQLRQLRSSGDESSAEIFDEYLAILDDFLVQTQTAVPSAKSANALKPESTNAKSSTAKPTATFQEE